jgi:hypothetical protein
MMGPFRWSVGLIVPIRSTTIEQHSWHDIRSASECPTFAFPRATLHSGTNATVSAAYKNFKERVDGHEKRPVAIGY